MANRRIYPQRVVKQRGVVRAEEFDPLSERARQPESLVEFFQSTPGGSEPNLKRKRDKTRTIEW
jgi:hypothetical protein